MVHPLAPTSRRTQARGRISPPAPPSVPGRQTAYCCVAHGSGIVAQRPASEHVRAWHFPAAWQSARFTPAEAAEAGSRACPPAGAVRHDVGVGRVAARPFSCRLRRSSTARWALQMLPVRVPTRWLLLGAVGALAQLSGCRALTFELPSNGVQKCFYEHAKKEVIMEANFRVIGKDYDNVPTVDAEVKTPQGKQVLKEMQKTRGHLDFVPAVDGVHAFCFRQHTRGKQAILSLNIRSGERDSFSTSIAQKGACPVQLGLVWDS